MEKTQSVKNTGRRAGTFKKWFTPIRALFGMINQMNTKKDKLVETGRQLPNKKEFKPVGSS
jgi:hypothetical protein